MAKITLLDFTPADRDRLAAEKYDVELKSTGWTSGREEPLVLPGSSEVIFYQIENGAAAAEADFHAGTHEALAGRVREGVRVICFVGGGGLARLTNIVGPVEGLQVQAARAEAVVFNPRALFHVPFERYKPYIARTFRLLAETFGDGVWEKETEADGRYEFLAKTGDGAPVAMTVRRGKGYLMFLPSFGPKNIEIAAYLLKDRLPLATEVPAAAGTDWLAGEDYIFPELRALVTRREEEKKRFEEILADYDRQIKEMKSGGQEDFLRLLDGEGDTLKKAVVAAFRYLGWGRVVDVDMYWKNTIRDKEEDVWIIEPAEAAVEAGLRKGDLILVLVRGGRNWATDDECALLQKFKGRRMQEFDNTRMKAVLVGNYYSEADPKSRPSPFSAAQVEEAQKDGNGLLTSYELFRAIKAEKENRVTKDALREQVRLKTGLLAFDI